MRTKVETWLPVSPNVAFEYLLHMKECSAWMGAEEIMGLALLFERGQYAGFLTPNTDDSLPPLVAEIDSIMWGEFVAYKPVVAAAENVSKRARRFFPFKSMKQWLQAVEDGKGCLVSQEFELEPNGRVRRGR